MFLRLKNSAKFRELTLKIPQNTIAFRAKFPDHHPACVTMAVMFMTRPRSNMMYWLKSDSLALQAVPEWSQPSFAVRSFHSELAVTLALNKR